SARSQQEPNPLGGRVCTRFWGSNAGVSLGGPAPLGYCERMSYSFGRRSLEVRAGIVPELQRVVDLAIKITKQDFSLVSGLRTAEEQMKHVTSGTSKTLNSRHLTGHAVDIVP